ncbi:MAG: TrmJ/YjtD family RNA methyltransferase [Deltaproteobacteria bacterium]|nr:MAG: TrmJ/YjtD family RNA methyltransferase [Deltaproteobacteria bacterium]
MKDQLRIVMCRPTRPGNVGAAARAMKTMGIRSLVLVDPLHPADDQDAVARARDGRDLLAAARTVATVEEAVADCVFVVGFSARDRALGPPVRDVREVTRETLAHAAHGPVAFVFGTERDGLSNAELAACHALARIPTDGEATSLNLASAIQLACYELHLATLAERAAAPAPEATPATRGDVLALLARLHRALVAVGPFAEGDAKLDAVEQRALRLLDRAALGKEELRALHAMLKWMGH